MVDAHVEADAANQETGDCEEEEALTHIDTTPYRTCFHTYLNYLLLMEEL